MQDILHWLHHIGQKNYKKSKIYDWQSRDYVI
jgi:hypothetical protein